MENKPVIKSNTKVKQRGWQIVPPVALVLFLAACSSGIDTAPQDLSPTASDSVKRQLRSTSDDAEETSSGSIRTGSAAQDLDFSYPGQRVGLRFSSLSIPQGAEITKAYVRFKASRSDSGSTTLTIRAHDTDSASSFKTSKRNISSRSTTSASERWSPSSWREGSSYSSDDISEVVQEVVNRRGWDSGNALALIVTGDSSSTRRRAVSANRSLGDSPTLYVSYESSRSGGGGDNDDDEPTTPSSGQGSSCLNDRGDLIKLRGSYSDRVTVFKRKDVKIDASDLKVKNRGNAFVASFNRGSFCLSGGTYATSISRSSSWATFHGNAAIYLYRNEGTTVERVAVLNAGDGFSVKDDVPNFVIRDSYGDDLHDDFVENDRFNNGTVKNNLVDNAFTAFSCREEADRVSPRNVTVKMQNNLIALRRQSNGGSHNDLFKWGRDTKKGCRLELRDNIFVIENDNAGYINPGKDPRVDYSPLVESACKGHKNTVIYLGNDKRYLDELKKASPTCFTITDDLGIWKKARAKWFDAHPQFRKYE